MSNKSNTKKYITLAVLSAAGLAFTACSSTHQERTDYSTMGYSYEPAMAEPSGAVSSTSYQQTTTSSAQQAQSSSAQASSQQTAAAQSGDVTIPLHEEQVNIGKTAISEPVTIRKVVTTETVSQPVQLRRETLVIDHNVGGAAGASGGDLSGAFQEKTMTINLQQEQPLIQKQTVVKDNVTVRRNASESQATISQQVRKENVEVDKPASGNVTLEGPFREIRESAGAQPASQQSQPQQQQQQDNK